MHLISWRLCIAIESCGRLWWWWCCPAMSFSEVHEVDIHISMTVWLHTRDITELIPKHQQWIYVSFPLIHQDTNLWNKGNMCNGAAQSITFLFNMTQILRKPWQVSQEYNARCVADQRNHRSGETPFRFIKASVTYHAAAVWPAIIIWFCTLQFVDVIFENHIWSCRLW